MNTIKQIKITNLFNLFNHTITLDNNITIIHGPNGIGKTTILRFIDGIFNKNHNMLVINSTTFDTFQVSFVNSTLLLKSPDITLLNIDDSTPKVYHIQENSRFMNSHVENLATLIANKQVSRPRLKQKTDLFEQLINDIFLHKHIITSSQSGLLCYSNKNNVIIPLYLLSRAEKLYLAMIYRLIFDTQPNTLVLIDTPENSLHITWQHQFITTLNKISDLIPLKFLIATHSPAIINNHWELTTELLTPQQSHSNEIQKGVTSWTP